VMGLPGDIGIIDSPEFVRYMATQVDKMKEMLPTESIKNQS